MILTVSSKYYLPTKLKKTPHSSTSFIKLNHIFYKFVDISLILTFVIALVLDQRFLQKYNQKVFVSYKLVMIKEMGWLSGLQSCRRYQLE